MSEKLFKQGGQSPIPNRLGARVRLKEPYRGWDEVDRHEGTIVEMIGRNAFGVPMYGVHLDGYTCMTGDRPVTVDFAANEFADEHGEAYQEKADEGFQALQDWLKGE